MSACWKQGDSVVEPPQFFVGLAEIVKRLGFAAPVADITVGRDRPLETGEGVVELAEVPVGDSRIVQRPALAVPVAGRLGNVEGLSVAGKGLVEPPPLPVSHAEVIQDDPFTTPVAKAAGGRQGDLMRGDPGGPVLPEIKEAEQGKGNVAGVTVMAGISGETDRSDQVGPFSVQPGQCRRPID